MKTGIVGCAGRMGRMLMQTVLSTDGLTLAGGSEHAGNETVGQDLGQLIGAADIGVSVTEDAPRLFEACDVVIDFTVPMATVMHGHLAADTGTALIVGTTGMDDDQLAQLASASDKTIIVQAGNMSLGVNMLLGLVKKVSSVLGEGFDIEVLEMHHRHKVDAPSGTALMLAAAAAEGRGVDVKSVSQRVRDGQTGPRRSGDIGFATLRGGDVVGEHTVMFAGERERIEITHKANSRAIFANGAIHAALWTRGREPGLYSMQDVLGF